MKKVLIGLLAVCTIFLIETTAFGADITSELIGKFSFDENVINDATGVKAEAVKPGSSGEIGISTAGNWSYVDGVKGSAIYLSAPGYSPRGLDLGICPSDAKNYTVSLWVKQLDINHVAPIVWIGASVQKSPNWVGIMSYSDGYMGEENSGPILAAENRIKSIKVTPTAGKGLGYIKNTNYIEDVEDTLKTFDWTNITMVVDDGVGKLYYDGQFVADSEGITMPDVLWDDTVSFYLGADAWNDIFEGYVDELYIYDRALTEDDINYLISKTNASNESILGLYPDETVEIDTYTDDEIYVDFRKFVYSEMYLVDELYDQDVIIFSDDEYYVSVENYEKIARKIEALAEKLDIKVLVLDTENVAIVSDDDFMETYLMLMYESVFGSNTDGLIVCTYSWIDFNEGKMSNEYMLYTVGNTGEYINSYGISRLEEILGQRFHRMGENDDWYETRTLAFDDFLVALKAFEKEGRFFMPYNYLNPYRTSREICVQFLIKVCIILAVIGIFRKLLLGKTVYHMGRKIYVKEETGVCVHCASFYHNPAEDMYCPFCDRSDFMIGNFRKTDLPDKAGSVILDKNDFVDMYKKYVDKFKFYPSRLKNEICEESIRQVYLSYVKEEAVLEERAGIRYGWGDKNGTYYKKINNNQYVYLKNIANLPHMNSRKIVDRAFILEETYVPDEIIKKIEPFVIEKEDKIKDMTLHQENGEFYAPVWRMDVRYGKRLYTFFMNGQNGQIAGEVAIGKLQWWLPVCVGSVGIYTILSFVFNLIALL